MSVGSDQAKFGRGRPSEPRTRQAFSQTTAYKGVKLAPVAPGLRCAGKGVPAGTCHPPVELIGDDAHSRAEDLRVDPDPLLQVRAFLKTGLGQGHRPGENGVAGIGGKDKLASHTHHRASAARSASRWLCQSPAPTLYG